MSDVVANGQFRDLRLWFVVFAILAAINFYVNGVSMDWPPLGRLPLDSYPVVRAVAIGTNWLWLIGLVASPFFLRWRALWLLVFLPVLLFWPAMEYQIIAACVADRYACP